MSFVNYEFKRRIYFILSFVFISILDHLIWLTIKILPSKRIFKVLEKRFFREYKLSLSKIKANKIKNYVIRVISIRISQPNLFCSCLSLSIISQCIFDLLGIENTLFLGIHKKNGKKIPHAWITYSTNKNIQIKISKVEAIILKSI